MFGNKNNKPKCRYRQQLGAERQTAPLSSLHDRPSDFAIAYSRIAVVLTIIFWILYATSVVIRQFIDNENTYQFTTEAFGYFFIVTFLTLSALIYLITRQGALQTFAKHQRIPQRLLDEHFANNHSSVTVLVPSYDEEIEVVQKPYSLLHSKSNKICGWSCY